MPMTYVHIMFQTTQPRQVSCYRVNFDSAQRSFDVLTAAQAELEAYACKYELAEDVVAKLAKLLRDLVPVENGRSRS